MPSGAAQENNSLAQSRNAPSKRRRRSRPKPARDPPPPTANARSGGGDYSPSRRRLGEDKHQRRPRQRQSESKAREGDRAENLLRARRIPVGQDSAVFHLALDRAHPPHLRRAARRVDVGGGRPIGRAPRLDLRTPPPRRLLLARPLGHRGQGVAAAQGARTAQGRLQRAQVGRQMGLAAPQQDAARRGLGGEVGRGPRPGLRLRFGAPQVALRRRAALRARVGVRAARGCRHAHAARSYLMGLPAHPDNHRAANDLTDGQDEGGGRQKRPRRPRPSRRRQQLRQRRPRPRRSPRRGESSRSPARARLQPPSRRRLKLLSRRSLPAPEGDLPRHRPRLH